MKLWIFIKSRLCIEFVAIILITVSLIVCLLLVEGVGRVTGLLKHPSLVYRFSATKGYELDPAHESVNMFGLRDREFPFRKSPNTFRLLALGDSFTYGAGLAIEETYVKQLEAILNQKLDERGIQYEVLNAGVPGYNTNQELLHLQEVGLQLDPDMILLCFTLGDAELGSFGLKHVERRIWLIQVKEWIKANFALYPFIRLRLGRLMDQFNAKRYGVEVGGSGVLPLIRAAAGESDAGWEFCRQSLAGFASISRELGIPVLLIIYPILIKLDDTYPYNAIHTMIDKTAKSFGISHVDLLPHFIGLEPAKLWVSPKDSHPNASANAIAASGIYSALLSQGYISKN